MSLCNNEAGSTGSRALWSAVVLQAKGDIEAEPINSVEYAQAVAFFTGGGEWAHGRANIADFLDIHPDDLERCGRRWIAARRQQEGLPAETPRLLHAAQPTRLKAPLNLAGLVAIPALSQRKHRAAADKPERPNPFNPFRRHASRELNARNEDFRNRNQTTVE